MANLTIFYTDDDEDDLSIFTDAVELVSKDIQLLTYNGGQKLLNAIKNPSPKPNVVFLDLNMPGKNGFDVLIELQNAEIVNTIPIIIFSTSNDPFIIEKCRALGANYFVTKPVLMEDMIKIIKHAIEINWNEFVNSDLNFIYRG